MLARHVGHVWHVGHHGHHGVGIGVRVRSEARGEVERHGGSGRGSLLLSGGLALGDSAAGIGGDKLVGLGVF